MISCWGNGAALLMIEKSDTHVSVMNLLLLKNVCRSTTTINDSSAIQ